MADPLKKPVELIPVFQDSFPCPLCAGEFQLALVLFRGDLPLLFPGRRYDLFRFLGVFNPDMVDVDQFPQQDLLDFIQFGERQL